MSMGAREAWQMIEDHHRITRVPRRTLLGALLCRLGRHKWVPAGTTTKVLPTGTALLVYTRDENYRCERRDCSAKRVTAYKRESWTNARTSAPKEGE